MDDDEQTPDPLAVLLRLLVGGAVRGTDAVLGRVLPPELTASSAPETAEEDTTEESRGLLARQVLIGLLFEAYGVASRGASAAGRVAATTGRFWGSVLDPIWRSRMLGPVRAPAEYVLDRGTQELERWAKIGRAEEQRSRDAVSRLMGMPVEEIVDHLRSDPAMERLVQAQAQSLLHELAEDPSLASVIRAQGDRYVDHLHEHPQAVQELIRGQSVGLAEEVANTVRQRTVSVDILLERLVRTVLRRRPRRELPPPSEAIIERARGPAARLAATRDASLLGHYAGLASRAVALGIDLGIIAAVTLFVSWAALSLLAYIGIDIRNCPPVESGIGHGALLCLIVRWTSIVIGASFPWLYFLFFWTTTGQTPGKAAMGVRIVRLDGHRMHLWTATVRLVGFCISLVSGGLGFVLVLADNRRQALHDKIARTCVIYSWDAHGDAHLQRLFPRLFGP